MTAEHGCGDNADRLGLEAVPQRACYAAGSDGYVVHADRRAGGAVGLYITASNGDTTFLFVPAPAVAAVVAVLREITGADTATP